MNYRKGPDRSQTQLLPPCLEDYVAAEAPVRFIDAFVEGLELKELGFQRAEPNATGRPPYDPGDLLKLYVYGYLNRIRSSRRLEAEARRNVELMWLLRSIVPDFKTIADFRKDNRACFKGVLKQFNLLCRKLDLFGAELVAVDGSKFKAYNHPKRLLTAQQLSELFAQVEARIEQYLEALDDNDLQAEGAAPNPGRQELAEKISALRERKGQYKQWLNDLSQSQQETIGETDPESRLQKTGQVGYNVQLAVDAKHDLIVESEVVQDANDLQQLSPMAQAARQELAAGESLKVVADAGYYSAPQVAACERAGIETYVPANRHASGQSKGSKAIYPKEAFVFDALRDSYRCPGGQELARAGESRHDGLMRVEYHNFSACRECRLRPECTQSRYRRIYRSRDEAAVERLAQRVAQRPDLVAKRKSIVEHVFGTLRHWGQDEFITRGLAGVRAEFSLSCLAYNIRRACQLISVQGFKTALQTGI
jgi:transposase